MRFALPIILVCLICYWFSDELFHRTGKPAPPELTQKLFTPPIQGKPKSDGVKFSKGYLKFLASYEVTARVLSRTNYRFDESAKLSPMDFALGWGPMSGPTISDKLSITQGARFYHYSWKDAPPVPPDKIALNSANTHLIPANDDIRKKLNRVSKNQIVTLKGELVYYHEDDGKGKWWDWRSSMTRADTGAGACEVLYVEDVTIY